MTAILGSAFGPPLCYTMSAVRVRAVLRSIVVGRGFRWIKPSRDRDSRVNV